MYTRITGQVGGRARDGRFRKFAGKCAAGRQAALTEPRDPIPILARGPRDPSYEAHLSAKEAQARPYSRVSRPHAYSRRPPRAQAAPQQGPPPAHALAPMAPPRRRPAHGPRRKRRRLSRSGEFDRVYREGRSHSSRHLVVYSFPREPGGEGPRLGVSVGRRVGGAVDRNRVKRLLRESFWAMAPELPEGHDFVIVARADAGALAGHDAGAMEGELREVLRSAGLVAGGRGMTRAARDRRRPCAASTSAPSPRRCPSAASTTPAARTTPSRRSGGTAYCGARSLPPGVSYAATPGATAASTSSRTRRSSPPIAMPSLSQSSSSRP